jgi:hypothetical protein
MMHIVAMCTYFLHIGLTALGSGPIYDAYRGYAHVLASYRPDGLGHYPCPRVKTNEPKP